MLPSIVVLGIQMYNVKMRSSKAIIKSNAEEVMAKYGFGRRFHELKYFKVTFNFFIFLEFIINLRASLQKFVENINLM